MVDFLMISTRASKRGSMEIYPKFIIKNSKDLMIRGGDFYAIWLEDRGMWSTSEQDVTDTIDRELDAYAEKYRQRFDGEIKVLHMWDSETGVMDRWHRYCQKHMRDRFHMLDEYLTFSNTEIKKEDYVSRKLDYALEEGPCDAWDRLVSVLYSPEERHKIEWAIGSIVNGDSKKLEKFMVLYGAAGTGKSTILNIIQQLFGDYVTVFDARALGNPNSSFALEPFRTNPLVAIQHDGDLSHIEDNTRLNSLVSHELMTVSEKYTKSYANRFKCFLFMGTNKPVKITDAKSGLIRRLVDVSPTGDKVSFTEYKKLMKQISFELGHIAYHCKQVYEENPGVYDNYIPLNMLGASNDFFNFVQDSWNVFKKNDSTTLIAAYEMYDEYCKDAKVAYPYSRRIFKEELKNYFHEYHERITLPSGERVRNYYSGFRTDKFEEKPKEESKPSPVIIFDGMESQLDEALANCPAQYASRNETPKIPWDEVSTKLCELDTTKLHYVLAPDNYIFIDFDIPDEEGNKSFERNLEEASKWPPTYAEVSKSGKGIHLHYIYNGDVTKLSKLYGPHIEIKRCDGKRAIRRILKKFNSLPIAIISSGLPLIEEKKVVNFERIKSENALRKSVEKNLKKEVHADTRSSVDFIKKILDDAYESGMPYDLSDMRNGVLAFAARSTHQSDYCVKLVSKMHFKSKEEPDNEDTNDRPIVFFDVETFPNLFLVCWKKAGENIPIVRMINPQPHQIEELLKNRLIGFNCRRYDNHMLYGCLIGYTPEQLYHLSKRIIAGGKDCFFGEAYNLSYTDIYDFAASSNKMSLKKLEIQMGIHHQELGMDWDQPVPEDKWVLVAEYCDNDVLATEAAFNYLANDWTARQILADLAEMTVNDTTNSLTTRIIFQGNRSPQSHFNYRNLADPVKNDDVSEETYEFLKRHKPLMLPYSDGSILPFFPGYKFEKGVSSYMDVEEVGEGGYVYAEPGMHYNVALLDVASMHPNSIISECLFGPEYTERFTDIVNGRIQIKHKNWPVVETMLDGKLKPYIQKVESGELTAKDLANALKTAINSVYGLTSASFTNPFKDERNIDNIVAKRGALFMVDLRRAVQEKGFTVAHVKTDSIKIPDATPEIISFVMEMGRRYGYEFEHEATYERMCLVNDAVYIAKYASKDFCQSVYNYIPEKNEDHENQWTATGTQFAVPYVFKSLFSKEPIELKDLCETMSVTSSLYLDMNEGLPDVEALEKEYKKHPSPELEAEIAKGHNYHFIGRVGLFCPIKPGKNGGVLLRRSNTGGYAAVGGTKGYRWLEEEMVRNLNKQDDIDISYYNKLVDKAVEKISEYGSFEEFVSNDPPPWR